MYSPQSKNLVFKSVVLSDEDALQSIMCVHNEGRPFELDPCYSIGNFYKSKIIPEPKLKFDISIQSEGVRQSDVRNLPINANSVNSIVFDPPFMFGHHGQTKNNVMNKRFSMFDRWNDLVSMYCEALKEFNRVLTPGGLLAFKCQDYTDSKTTLTHCYVHNWALEAGFYPKDLLILACTTGRIYNPNLVQRHFRKFHCYWYVFTK